MRMMLPLATCVLQCDKTKLIYLHRLIQEHSRYDRKKVHTHENIMFSFSCLVLSVKGFREHTNECYYGNHAPHNTPIGPIDFLTDHSSE